jgi:hypothetical protein
MFSNDSEKNPNNNQIKIKINKKSPKQNREFQYYIILYQYNTITQCHPTSIKYSILI